MLSQHSAAALCLRQSLRSLPPLRPGLQSRPVPNRRQPQQGRAGPATPPPAPGGATLRKRVDSEPPLLTATVTTETVREIPQDQTAAATVPAIAGDTRGPLASMPLSERARACRSRPVFLWPLMHLQAR